MVNETYPDQNYALPVKTQKVFIKFKQLAVNSVYKKLSKKKKIKHEMIGVDYAVLRGQYNIDDYLLVEIYKLA